MRTFSYLVGLLFLTGAATFLYSYIDDYMRPSESLLGTIGEYIMTHPLQTSFTVVGLFAPTVLSGPMLYLLGFTSLGPRAASFASLLQSRFGIVAARSSFAYLQSARMGGYGLDAVNTGFKVVSSLGSVGSYFWGSEKPKSNGPWETFGSLLILLFVAFILYILARVAFMSARFVWAAGRAIFVGESEVEETGNSRGLLSSTMATQNSSELELYYSLPISVSDKQIAFELFCHII
ncbi:hypothetical protein DSL72_005949 [Monilinia vaccinii-corymbosi]|uniref:Uncharacterized protein n=1 Tax=Monilinia vaccinii-corymbosi TaxID=61207 RepID=A0A8A3PGM1_9HELO|nr:hypothetical protein DSL72_005949 [Monilinia vaccinii-corymbosi]